VKILSVWTHFPPQVGGLDVVVQQQAEDLVKDDIESYTSLTCSRDDRTIIKMED
jgi:hypothetical protein